jgi:hypothetical protein
MNMISTGAFQTEMNSSSKQQDLVKKLTAVWEKKNSKAARAGGVSLMALSLGACGSDDDTPFSQADVDAAVLASETSQIGAINTAFGTAFTADDESSVIFATIAASDNAPLEASAAEALVAQAAAEADAATALVAQAAAEADAATALVAQAAAEAATAAAQADAATALIAQATAEAATVTATADAAAANAAKATADASLATAQADLTAKTAQYDALVVSNTALQASLDASEASLAALNAPKSDALTTAVDSVVGSLGNDAFSGTGTTLTAGDAIIDSSTSDSDSLVISHTGGVSTANTTIAGIENLTFDITSFATPTINLTGVGAGTAVTLNQKSLGGTGDVTVTNVTKNMSLTAGENITGTLTVNTITAGSSLSIDAGSAATVTTQTAGAKGVMTITGGSKLAATTTLASKQEITTTADASTINIDGVTTAAGDSATVNFGKAANIVNGAGETVENLTVSSSFAATTTATGTATIGTAAATTYTITGSNDVVLSGNESMFDGKTVTDSSTGASTVKITTLNTSDLSKVAVDKIDIADASNAVTVSANDNATVSLSVDVNAGGLTLDSDDDGATTYLKGTLNLALDADVDAAAVTVDGSGATDDGYDTVNLTVNVDNTTAGSGFDLITGAAVVNASGAKELFLAATSTMKSLDASEMTGKVTVNYDNTNDIATVTTGSGADTITNATTAIGTKATIKTNGGNDNFTMMSTAKADIDGGDGYDTLTVGGDATNITVSNIEGITTSGAITNMNASMLSGQSYNVGGANAVTFGTAAANFDTNSVDLSSLVINNVTGFTVDATNGLSTKLFTSGEAVTVSGSSIADTIKGTANGDSLTGNGGVDLIHGNSGSDTISGSAGGDYLYGDGGGTGEIQTVSLTYNSTRTDTINIAGTAVTYAAAGNATTSATNAVTAINGTAALTNIVTASSAIGVVTLTYNVDGDFAQAAFTGGGAASGINTAIAATSTAGTVGTAANDTLTGGAAADVFMVGAGAGAAKPSATVFDTITDFTASSDVINYTRNVMSITTGATKAAGTAAISTAGIATFNAADDTLLEKVTATEAGINASGTRADGQVAAFMHGSDAYVFISDGVDGVAAADTMIKLTGIDLTATASDTLTLSAGDFTIA